MLREQKLISTDAPDSTTLHKFSCEANTHEQALINEFSVQNWPDLKGHGRYAKYWQKNNERYRYRELCEMLELLKVNHKNIKFSTFGVN